MLHHKILHKMQYIIDDMKLGVYLIVVTWSRVISLICKLQIMRAVAHTDESVHVTYTTRPHITTVMQPILSEILSSS